jgi:hypothetical protein
MIGNAMTRTAGWWLLCVASGAATDCTVYESSLLPPQPAEAGASDARSERSNDVGRDQWPQPTDDGDASADTSLPTTEDAADALDLDVREEADGGDAEAGAPTCDPACIVRCEDGVMNGSETRIDCGGDCPPEGCPPAPLITNLIVNDMNMGQDGIANNYQWSIGMSFGDGGPVFGDRTYTLGTLPSAAAHLVGKPWIKTAADSKLYSGSNPPIATASISGSYVFIAIDDRQPAMPLVEEGYFYQSYGLPVLESGVLRNYTVWRKAIASSPTTVVFPSASSVASFYLIIVE